MTLIERLEALDGPNIEVFNEVFAAIHGPKPPRVHGGSQELTDWLVAFTPFYKMLEAGAWTDAAMSIVPDGLRWCVDTCDGEPRSFVEPPHPYNGRPFWGKHTSTPAIALCIAALKARGVS